MSGRPLLVSVGFTVQNVDYSQLSQNAAMKSAFEDGCKVGIVQTVNSQAGPCITVSDVRTTLTEGSVNVNAVVTPPAGSSPTAASGMQTDLLRDESSLANNVAAQVTAIPGLSGIASGAISIGNLTARTTAGGAEGGWPTIAPGPGEPAPSTGLPVASVAIIGLTALLVICALAVWWCWPVRGDRNSKAPDDDASCVEAGIPGGSMQVTEHEADKPSGCVVDDFTFHTPLAISARLDSPEIKANCTALKASLKARGFTEVLDLQALSDPPMEYLLHCRAMIVLLTDGYAEYTQPPHCERAELKYYLEHKQQFLHVFPIKLSGSWPDVPPDEAGQASGDAVFSHEGATLMDLHGRPFDADAIASHVATVAMQAELFEI